MSSVVTSVQTGDIESAKNQFVHFAKIDRAEQFKSYYIKTIRSQVKNLWEDKDETDRIVTVYEELENNLKSHVAFIKSVFGEEQSGNVLLELYSSILNNLPIKETIKNVTWSRGDREPEESFVTLGSIRLISTNFMAAVKGHLDELELEKEATSTSTPTSAPGKKEIEKFVQSIWQPFGHSMVHFETLLSQLLLSRASNFRIDGDLMNLSEHFSQTKHDLHDLHNEVLSYCSDVTDNFGLKMTISCLQAAHAKLAERAIVAMEDAKAQATKDGNDAVDEWGLFASGLALLDNIGPWFDELSRMNREVQSRLVELEQYSSKAMMNQSQLKDQLWQFNIFQLCAPSKFGELQGLIDLALQTEQSSPSLLPESTSSFGRVAQYSTDLTFSSFFNNVESSLASLCSQSDTWSKKESPLPLCGYSPSEMITRVGDNLLTLPQYLDPLSNKNTKISLHSENKY